MRLKSLTAKEKKEAKLSARRCEKLAPILLREEFAQYIEKHPKYSVRMLARDTGLSAAMVSFLFSGKRKLSVDLTERLCIALKVPARRRTRILKAAVLDAIPTQHDTDLARRFIESHGPGETYSVEADQFQFFSHWYHVAILDLCSCADFVPNIEWIAGRLSISQETVKFALDRLFRLGMLRKKNGRWIKSKPFIFVPTTQSHSAVRNFHSQMIEKAKECLYSPVAEDFARRRISGITIALDPKKLDEAKRRIVEFESEMLEFLTDGPSTEVYQMNVQLFPLTCARSNRA